jgi:hypothetical protein
MEKGLLFCDNKGLKQEQLYFLFYEHSKKNYHWRQWALFEPIITTGHEIG